MYHEFNSYNLLEKQSLALTKEEKKNLKELVRLYEQVGYVVDYDTEYHAMQFDKVMEFLLDMKKDDEWVSLNYKDIEYMEIVAGKYKLKELNKK